MSDKMLKKLKEWSARLKSESTALFYAYKSPETGLLPRLLILLTLAYALSPVDLIPDFIPLLGLLDDILILPVFISLSLKLIPPGVMETARLKARDSPLSLNKKWYFALPVIVLWLLAAALVIKAFL